MFSLHFYTVSSLILSSDQIYPDTLEQGTMLEVYGQQYAKKSLSWMKV